MPEVLPIITVKSGGEVHLRNRHHAIFKTAILHMPEVKNGSIVEVRGASGDFLCYATLNTHAYICGRAIAFERGEPLALLRASMEKAIAIRRRFFSNEDTTAFRLINAEGDAIPGLIVDQYGDVLVMQLTTLGMDRLREWITAVLWDICKPKAIFEKSAGPGRQKESLEPVEGWVRGEAANDIVIKERGMKLHIQLAGSQKTGFFLDQREMRSIVRSFASGRTVLDCCSYVGGFSVSALLGGAKAADAVDYDAVAIEQAKKHVEMNGLDAAAFGAYAEDVFQFLRRKPAPRDYDFIILDPPAFAKRSSDIEQAKRAYVDMNRMAMQILPQGGLLLTCSCSYQISTEIFQTIVFNAARQAKRSVRILQRHRQALDHPVNLFHPEVDYLKSLLLWVE